MLAKRIIPCLDVTDGKVVKGVNFVELREAGDPVEVARRYDEQGADEITFLDITATSDNRGLILKVIEDVAAQVFIPLTVGGGVREVGDIRRLLNSREPIRFLSTLPASRIRILSAILRLSTVLSASLLLSTPREQATINGKSILTADVSIPALMPWNGLRKFSLLVPARFCLPVWTATGLKRI